MSNARAHIIYIIGVILSVMLFAGCEEPVETKSVEIPIQFVLPVGEKFINWSDETNETNDVRRISGVSHESESAQNRALGDPGTTEELDRPTHAYVFIVYHLSDASTVLSCIIDTALVAGNWQPRRALNGDSVLVYSDKIIMEIPVKEDKNKTADVYIAVSNTSLTLKNGGNTIVRSPKANWPTTESEVQNITFEVNDAIQLELQHIYSSPCNYKPDGSTYYGRISTFSTNVPSLQLMLYHVASKVDLMWNVPTDKQAALRVVKVKAKNLFKGDAYLFKPTAKAHATFTSETGYTPSDLAGNVPGTWWAGRSYFYTMAYQASDDENKFVMQMDFDIKNQEADGTPTYTYGLKVCKADIVSEVFAPWIRGQITISDKLTEDKSKTIDIGE